jgi:hypothetical protein
MLVLMGPDSSSEGSGGTNNKLTVGKEKLALLITGNARVYSSSKPMSSIVSRESTMVTPHPLKLGARGVNGDDRSSDEETHLLTVMLDKGKSSSFVNE